MSLTPDQRLARLGHIFSTDVAAALGADKTKTPIQLYLEKKGESLPEPVTDYESPARFGLHFQDAIGKLYTEHTGIPLVRDDRTLFSPRYPWMGSHFDFRAALGEKRLVEIKFFHPMRRKEFGEPGSRDMPTKPLLQCLHEMAVAEIDVIDLAVLFGNSEFCIFTVERDQATEEALVIREREFMDCLESSTLPEPMSAADLRRVFPRDSGRIIEADDTLAKAIFAYSEATELRKRAEEREQELKLAIMRRIEDAERVTYQRQTLLTYKSDNQGKPVRRMIEGSTTRLREEYPAVWLEISEEVQPSRRFLVKV